MSKRAAWLLAGFLAMALNVTGQRLGLLPTRVRWEQLRHDSLRIIYPEGHDHTARRVASLMLKVAAADPVAPGSRYKPISVVLQPQTNIANGYVGLAPYASEFFLQPAENVFSLGSLPWADLLAIHEFRHVQQLNAANTGFSHVIKTIFGDLAFNALYNLSVPDWFREGDAVMAETKWTPQGRGRLSQFLLPFYDKVIKDDPWKYYKVRRGSYKEVTPNEYALGYLMLLYGEEVFGEDTWDTILREAPRFKHLIRPFSGVVNEIYGKGNKGFYEDAVDWYCIQCRTSSAMDADYPMIPQGRKEDRRDFEDYAMPAVGEDGKVYAAVTTFDHIAAIVEIAPDGRRQRVHTLGQQQETHFDTRQDIFVWTDFRADPRWVRQDRNVIVIYDRRAGTKRIAWPEKGYFMPSLDHAGRRVAALHTDQAGVFNIHILDVSTGALLQALPNPENLYLGYPVFDETGRFVVSAARLPDGRMCLVEQDLTTGVIRQLTDPSYTVLGRPTVHRDWIFLTAGFRQLDQVFAVDRRTGQFYQISQGNRAHYNPAWDPVQESLVCSEYRLAGSKLVRLPGYPAQWIPLDPDDIRDDDIPFASSRNLLAEPPGKYNFTTSKYSFWSNAVNLHSWLITADDPVWGIELKSDNVLNTISMTGGYEYNRNTRASGPFASIRLGMWFPEITLGVSQISREIRSVDDREFRVLNDRLNLGFTVPLVFTGGAYQQALALGSTYYKGTSRIRPRVSTFEDFTFNFVSHQLVFVNAHRKGYRQPMPSFGQQLELTYSHQLAGRVVSQGYGALDVALPSFSPTNYLLLHGEYFQRITSEGSIQLGNTFSGARGFPPIDARKQYRVGATYGFPILYPDKGLGNIFYTRRIRAQAFYDMAFIRETEDVEYNQQSAGLEVIVDFDFPPVSLGVRYARLLDGPFTRPYQVEFFIPAKLF